MKTLMKIELPEGVTNHVRSVLHYNGLPIDARSLTDDILVQEGRKAPDAVQAETIAPRAAVTMAREE